jgi:hypothetical protein
VREWRPRANDFDEEPARNRPKARICRTLKWRDFPQSGREFEDFRSLRTHDLEILLKFSGIEDRVTAKHLTDWSAVADWYPERRYQEIGLTTPVEAAKMVECVKRLLKVL